MALVVVEETPPRGTRIAADFTPAPGTLLALASVTPAAGIPRLTLEPTAEVLAAAARGGPPSAPPPRSGARDSALAAASRPPHAARAVGYMEP